MKYDYSKENLEKLAKESWCLADMIEKLTGKKCKNRTLMKYINYYDIDISHWRKQLPKLQDDDYPEPTTDKQRKMLELRKQGFSFGEISEKIKCSKGTVSYFFRKKQREKVKERKEQYEPWVASLIKRISRFNLRDCKDWTRVVDTDWKQKLRSATSHFIKISDDMSKFGYKDVLAKYNNQTVVECYLTGDKIDLTKDDYALDHIIPISRGGSSELSNLAITTYIANASKSSMTEDEYVELCKKVLIHHGYKVTKDN